MRVAPHMSDLTLRMTLHNSKTRNTAYTYRRFFAVLSRNRVMSHQRIIKKCVLTYIRKP